MQEPVLPGVPAVHMIPKTRRTCFLAVASSAEASAIVIIEPGSGFLWPSVYDAGQPPCSIELQLVVRKLMNTNKESLVLLYPTPTTNHHQLTLTERFARFVSNFLVETLTHI